MTIKFKAGDKVVLPDGATGVVTRRHQRVGSAWGGCYDVMTGAWGTLGCGPWLCHQDELRAAEAAA